ncbi:MAG: transporter substrate-binding domain-containing protein [Planctomycetes bacterium]|nr:transporter substrate-binding domain-containing protein [Planctomycetota bacterium]
MRLQFALFACMPVLTIAPAVDADTLDDIRARGELIWGADREGGGPYVYPDPADPQRSVGFEVELADLLARELGVKSRFSQGNWDNLPAVLGNGQIDIVMNGYELTPARAGLMLATHPYYIYEMVLLAPRDHLRLKSWDDLRRKPGQPRAKVGVLVSSAAHTYLEQPPWADEIDLRTYDSR